jgi:hypothetical protein
VKEPEIGDTPDYGEAREVRAESPQPSVGPPNADPCGAGRGRARGAAVLTTNGFGGSKADQAAFGQELAADGYVVLSYSGLGFGGSGCPIELDDPDWDGKAASQLITFLGGGMAATDGTRVDYVIHDQTAHDGKHYAFDPRVGMIGGSYGGEVQFAAAEQDPRLDSAGTLGLGTWRRTVRAPACSRSAAESSRRSASRTSASRAAARPPAGSSRASPDQRSGAERRGSTGPGPRQVSAGASGSLASAACISESENSGSSSLPPR